MFDVDVVLVKLQTSLLGKLGICEPNKAFALQWGWWIWFFLVGKEKVQSTSSLAKTGRKHSGGGVNFGKCRT